MLSWWMMFHFTRIIYWLYDMFTTVMFRFEEDKEDFESHNLTLNKTRLWMSSAFIDHPCHARDTHGKFEFDLPPLYALPCYFGVYGHTIMWNAWFVAMYFGDGHERLWTFTVGMLLSFGMAITIAIAKKPFIHPNRRPPDKERLVHWLRMTMRTGLSWPEWIVWCDVQPYVRQFALTTMWSSLIWSTRTVKFCGKTMSAMNTKTTTGIRRNRTFLTTCMIFGMFNPVAAYNNDLQTWCDLAFPTAIPVQPVGKQWFC